MGYEQEINELKQAVKDRGNEILALSRELAQHRHSISELQVYMDHHEGGWADCWAF